MPEQKNWSSTLPSPLVASASSVHLGYDRFQPYNSFDADTATRWHSTVGGSHWIQIDLGTGNEIRPNSLAMTITSGSGDRRPSSLTVKGSNTGAFSAQNAGNRLACGVITLRDNM